VSNMIHRLRVSRAQAEKRAYDEGLIAGRAWVCEIAEHSQLAKLAALRDDPEVPWASNFLPSACSEATPSNCLGDYLKCGDDQEATDFWEEAVGEGVDVERPEFVRGFAEGALEVWDGIKDQI
jgi:hypothetical protein